MLGECPALPPLVPQPPSAPPTPSPIYPPAFCPEFAQIIAERTPVKCSRTASANHRFVHSNCYCNTAGNRPDSDVGNPTEAECGTLYKPHGTLSYPWDNANGVTEAEFEVTVQSIRLCSWSGSTCATGSAFEVLCSPSMPPPSTPPGVTSRLGDSPPSPTAPPPSSPPANIAFPVSSGICEACMGEQACRDWAAANGLNFHTAFEPVTLITAPIVEITCYIPCLTTTSPHALQDHYSGGEFPPCCSLWTLIGHVFFNYRVFSSISTHSFETTVTCGATRHCACVNTPLAYVWEAENTACASNAVLQDATQCFEPGRSWNNGMPWETGITYTVEDSLLPFGCSLHRASGLRFMNTFGDLTSTTTRAGYSPLCMRTWSHESPAPSPPPYTPLR